MNAQLFIKRTLSHYWRTNLAVIAGVATAVAVLAGALLVGDSVRGSLRELALQRLGKADLVLAGNSFFREALAQDIAAHPDFATHFTGVCPLVVLPGTVTNDANNQRAGNVTVYGVDERFWQFHAITKELANNDDVFISPGLARELAAQPEQSLVIRIEKPTDIPLESLHGRKDEAGATIRTTLREVLPAAQMGEFSLRPQQGEVRAVFVPLQRLRKYFDQDGKVNALLFAAQSAATNVEATAARILRERFQLADLGLTVRSLNGSPIIAIESASAVLNDTVEAVGRATAQALKLDAVPVLTYLANTIRSGTREIPYSLVTALDDTGLARLQGKPPQPPLARGIWLNDWAARDLGAGIGAPVTLEYFVWQSDGRLETKQAEFQVAGILPLAGAAADRHYAPDYPGITDTDSLSDWDPPFPLEMSQVREQDEDYWHRYRTTPKAFVQLADAQPLWATRYGKVTSLRLQIRPNEFYGEGEIAVKAMIERVSNELRQRLDPLQAGLSIQAVKAESVQAARGATDFGEYFSYFSFFLVVSALLLTSLFFKLGIEQRLRELGLLRALGFSLKQLRGLFLREGLVLAVLGSLLGLLGALLFGWLMIYGLRTWWVGAVGTTALRLHVTPQSLLLGFGAGVVTALLVIAATLRKLMRQSPRSLLGGVEAASALDVRASRHFARLPRVSAWALAGLFALLGLSLLAASAAQKISATGGFFGAGFTLLIAALLGWRVWLQRERRGVLAGNGAGALLRLGFRNAGLRPARSVLCIALIAAATFIIVAVDAFRRDGHAAPNDKTTGTGGYALMAEALVPIVRDPNSAQGREELNLNDAALNDVRFARFRLRPGDDTSCLNLYAPREPRLLGVPTEFIQEGRFSFAKSLAQTPAQQANPWLLLNVAQPLVTPDDPTRRERLPREVHVIGDANSLTYVLHKGVGDALEIQAENGERVSLRIVAALQDSLFQSELLMSETHFKQLFPSLSGQRVFLIDAPHGADVSAQLEERLSDYGFDATSAAEKLASFHRVENTYLSTFQALGTLGLLLGTIGLAAVLLRNVWERRRELALLRATGYQPQHLTWLVLAENLFLLGCGLLTGVVCALIAIAPALAARGGNVSLISLTLLLLTVTGTGLLASLLAVRAINRAPLLPALRAE